MPPEEAARRQAHNAGIPFPTPLTPDVQQFYPEPTTIDLQKKRKLKVKKRNKDKKVGKIMKTFLEYHKEQEIKEFSQWLESQGYDPQWTLDLESLLEAGTWEKVKKWGKGAALAGVLGAAALGGMTPGDSDAPSKQPQTQASLSQHL